MTHHPPRGTSNGPYTRDAIVFIFCQFTHAHFRLPNVANKHASGRRVMFDAALCLCTRKLAYARTCSFQAPLRELVARSSNTRRTEPRVSSRCLSREEVRGRSCVRPTRAACPPATMGGSSSVISKNSWRVLTRRAERSACTTLSLANGSATSTAQTMTYGRGGRHVSLSLASASRSVGFRVVAPILTTPCIEGVAKA